MLTFLAENLGTIIVGLVLAAVIAAIIVKLARDKKKGCSCGCAECQNGGAHKADGKNLYKPLPDCCKNTRK